MFLYKKCCVGWKMKILMLIDSLGIGGAETHVEALSLELTRHGHEVKIATSGGEIAQRLQKQGVEILPLPDFSTKNGRRGDTKFAFNMPFCIKIAEFLILQRKIREYVDGELPDVVHAHTRRTALGAKSVCKRRKIPLVTTAHALFLMKFPQNWLSCWGDRTIAVSCDIKNHLVRHDVPENQIEIVENGVQIP